MLLTDNLTRDITPRNPGKKFGHHVMSLVVHFVLKLLACIYFLVPGLGRFLEAQEARQQTENQSNPQMAGSGSLDSGILTEVEEDSLHPCWQRLQHLETLVTELYNKPTKIPPEKEDMLLESLNRIKSIEQDLQRTKKVRPLSTISLDCNQFCAFVKSGY